MYHEYKQHSVKSKSQIKQFNLEVQTQILNDILSNDATIQSFAKKNEFTLYQRQDIIIIILLLFLRFDFY
jgi:hypothetical protein